MPVSFAPVRSAGRSAFAPLLQPLATATPANDDHDKAGDDTLHAALRHFAVHGLGAARAACAEVEAAWLQNDHLGAETWLAICRALDKRLAADLESRIAQRNSATA